MPNGYVDPNQPNRRQPYQYRPQNSPYDEPTVPVQPEYYQQNGQRRAYNQPGQQGYYNQPRSQRPATTVYPDERQDSSPQPKRRRKGRTFGCLGTIAVLVILVILASSTVSKALAFGSAISTQAPFSTDTGYMMTSDRTNLLVMGYGGGTHDGAYLTDSMLIISVLPQSHHTSLISVPRDLWIQYPPNSGN
jgi:polyisoprenyl-teichoic acid--peptidoglycan teichoic acid transferase